MFSGFNKFSSVPAGNVANALLVGAKQPEKAIKEYTQAYDLAKKTGHKNLALIETNIKKVNRNATVGNTSSEGCLIAELLFGHVTK